MLQLNLFGGFRATVGSQPVSGFRYDKVRALLAFLALEAEAPVRRELLATLFWPELPDGAARLNLRQALFHLRQTLTAAGAPDVIRATQSEVQFCPGPSSWVDALAFSSYLGPNGGHETPPLPDRLEAAAALYSGPLLAGLSLPDSEPFEGWLVPLQQRFHQQALGAMEALAEQLLQRGAFERAQHYAQQQIALEPWHEVAHQQLMRALALSGQRGQALATFQRASEILEEELGVEPDAATCELARRIQAGELSPAPAWTARNDQPRPYKLPQPLSSFVGREQEMAQLAAWLRSASQRLITVVGPGGIGKSRLVLEVGEQLTEEFLHGACLVPLGSDGSPDVLVMAIATALNLSLDGHAPVREQLGDFLAEKSLLLLLDSFETFAGSATFVGDLLAYAPALKVLATSRVRLDLPGEWVLPLSGLPVSENPEGDPGEAARLFELRARQLLPGFAPSSEERVAIHNICALVEGVPLAIELAASWVRVLSCAEIERELRASRALLFDASPHRDGAPPLRPLEPLLDGSWRLLSSAEKYVFRRLAIFPTSFDRAAAEEVTGATLSVLRTLIDHSFLRHDDSDRYEVHTLLRDYGLHRLGEVPLELADARDRHASYYSALLAEWLPALRGTGQQEALAAIRAEIENVRAAWEWSSHSVRLPQLDMALEALFHFYDIRSWFEEGAQRFGAARAALEAWIGGGGSTRPRGDAQAPQRLLGKLLAREGWFLFHQGERERAQALMERSLATLCALGAARDQIFTLNYLAAILYHGGDFARASHLCEEAHCLATRLDDHYGIAIANNIAGQIAFMRGEYGAAEARSQASLAIERALGNRWSMAFSLYNLGNVLVAQGRNEEARQRFEESLTIRRELEDFRGIAHCYSRLGETEERLGELALAAEQHEDSLALFHTIGDHWGEAATRVRLARVALRQGEQKQAEALLRAALDGAAALHALPILMAGLTEWARLLVGRGECERAAQLLLLVCYHPAASRESREAAERLLQPIREARPAGTWRAWQHQAERYTVEEVLAGIVVG